MPTRRDALKLAAELQVLPAEGREALADRQVGVEVTRRPQDADAGVAELSTWSGDEG